MSFDKLYELIAQKNNPTVMGLDPKLEYIPEKFREGKSVSESLFDFNRALIDATADLIPAIKPQSAYYELYGLEGLLALDKTIRYAKQAGIYVILDAKRGDIGSTASAYAEGHLGEGGAGADCITVNPYLGSDGIVPFIDAAKKYDKALFSLVKTSNPSSSEFQDRLIDGKPLYRIVGEATEKWGEDNIGEYGYSRVGAVIGATHPEQLAELRAAMPHTFFLVPGYGAQGGTAADVAFAFRQSDKSGAIVNSSRALMCAYKGKGDDMNFAQFTRNACIEMRDALNAAMK
ncbi:MAG: orotidine-5'-phosphate decarboxylase [Clostridia bacterium]|nr:orotidine-5'-phosphate decarboxylase [Clostridia bacterium]